MLFLPLLLFSCSESYSPQQEIARQVVSLWMAAILNRTVQAELKIFLVASVDERAERRYKENLSKGIETDLQRGD